MKKYSVMYGVGKSKYLVNFHNGEKFNKDNSEFYDLQLFSNKKKMDKFIKELQNGGYYEK